MYVVASTTSSAAAFMPTTGISVEAMRSIVAKLGLASSIWHILYSLASLPSACAAGEQLRLAAATAPMAIPPRSSRVLVLFMSCFLLCLYMHQNMHML